jgi:hypothetical protein
MSLPAMRCMAKLGMAASFSYSRHRFCGSPSVISM